MAAAKGRSPEEVAEAVAAGVTIIGENYVQDAEEVIQTVRGKAQLHFIGRLQRNKAKRAVELFDMIQTVDSPSIAAEIDRRCAASGKVMPVLIEVNSAREPQKSGVFPENAVPLVRAMAPLLHIKVMGLMTMGTIADDVKGCRPYFAATKNVFEEIGRLHLPNVEMKYLSMGMSDSWQAAVSEGANMVRLGRAIFG